MSIGMNLYLLERIESSEYDQAMGFVVRAPTVSVARKLASERAGDEGAEVWLDRSKTSCNILSNKGSECVILRDFKAG